MGQHYYMFADPKCNPLKVILTLCQLAVAQNQYETAKLLLQEGAKVNATTDIGKYVPRSPTLHSYGASP